MFQVIRNRQIAASPAAVFAVLSDPHSLAGILPRVRRVELIEQRAGSARVATYMSLGPFGEFRSEGDVQWQAEREVVFRSRQPMLVEARWSLAPNAGGSDVRLSLGLDLAGLIGPLAALVPAAEVAKLVAPDLEAALSAVARQAEAHG